MEEQNAQLRAQNEQANSALATAQSQKPPKVRALSKEDRPVLLSLPLELDGEEVALELHEGETADECMRLFATHYTLNEQQIEMLTAELKSAAAPKKTVNALSVKSGGGGGGDGAAAAEDDGVAGAVRRSSNTMSEMEKMQTQIEMLKNQVREGAGCVRGVGGGGAIKVVFINSLSSLDLPRLPSSPLNFPHSPSLSLILPHSPSTSICRSRVLV